MWKYSIGSTSAIISLEIEDFKCYPNPVKDILQIRNDTGTELQVKLYNLQGQLLFTTHQNKMDMSANNTGVYVVEVNGIKKKVLKQ